MPPRTRTAAASARQAKKTGDELLEEIDPQKHRADTWICLRPDLISTWQEENAELERMRAAEVVGAGQRLASGNATSTEVKAQARKVQKLEAQIEAAQVNFAFENMSPDEKSALEAEHPPRKGDTFDAMAGFNRDAVQKEMVRACLAEPVFTDAGWERLMLMIPPGEWDELIRCCNEANGRVATLPKSALAGSLLRARSGTSSGSPSGGE